MADELEIRNARIRALNAYIDELGLVDQRTFSTNRNTVVRVCAWPPAANHTDQGRVVVFVIAPDGSWSDYLSVEEIEVEKGKKRLQRMVRADDLVNALRACASWMRAELNGRLSVEPLMEAENLLAEVAPSDGADVPEADDIDDIDDSYPPACTNPGGHEWPAVEEHERCLCIHCGADGDA